MQNSDANLRTPSKRVLYLFLGSLVVGLTALILASQGPDQEFRMIREVPSRLDPERLDRNISSVSRWPQWFYSTSQVTLFNSHLEAGSKVQIQIDPHKGMRKKFQLTAQVVEYHPGQKLSLQVLEDSSGRLTRIFDEIYWEISLKPTSQGSLIRGEVRAHSKHWRARLFGRMSERILMNQIFYPNLAKLADLRQPFSMDQTSQSSSLFSP